MLFMTLAVVTAVCLFAPPTRLYGVVGSVITLGYFMARTGHVDWESAFRRPDRSPQPPATPGATTAPSWGERV